MSIQTNKLPDNPQIEVIKSGKTGLFTNYIYKAIPLAFDESMSYYETLCGLLHYLKNTIIPTVNNNADAVSELQSLYEQLRSYVDNYFTNLDVQEEINNKLDQMVIDGTLPEIVASYLNSKAVFGFDNVESMKSATNLINGSYAKTLGYYSINDNGGAFYKIRKITNDDTVDEKILIALNDNTLVAELIIEEEMNIVQFGFNNNDDLNDINILNLTNLKCLDLNNYTYNCTLPINLKSNFTLKNGSIKSSADKIIIIDTKNNILIDNINLNGNNLAERGINITYSKYIEIKNCTIENTKLRELITTGIYLNKCEYININNNIIKNIGTTSTGVDEDHVVRGIEVGNTLYCSIDNCFIQNIYDSAKAHGDGIHFIAQGNQIGIISNNVVKNTTIDNCAYRCIKIQQYGVTIDSNNLINSDDTLETKQSNIAIYDNNATIRNNKITHKCYVPIMVGVVNENTTKILNTIIDKNYIVHSTSHYQGIITIPTNSELVKNLIISNNVLKSTVDTEDGILLLSSFENVQVINNIFDNVVNGVFDRTPNSYSYPVIRNYLTVNGNNGVVRNNLLYIDNTDTTFVTVTGNNVSYSNMLSSTEARNVVRVKPENVGEMKKYNIGNNKLSDNIWDGWRKVGSTTQRPTSSAYDGFIYYDETLHQNVTFYNGSWYLPDGSISS